MSPIHKSPSSIGLIIEKPALLLGLHSFRKLHLMPMASVQLIIFIMASKIIVCRINFGIKTNRHLNIRQFRTTYLKRRKLQRV